jgi:hypothetical protein
METGDGRGDHQEDGKLPLLLLGWLRRWRGWQRGLVAINGGVGSGGGVGCSGEVASRGGVGCSGEVASRGGVGCSGEVASRGGVARYLGIPRAPALGGPYGISRLGLLQCKGVDISALQIPTGLNCGSIQGLKD